MRVLLFVLFMLTAIPAYAQDDEEVYDSGEDKLRNNWAFNVQVSSVGFVLGAGYNHKLAPGLTLNNSLDLFWVNGKNEQQVYDALGNSYSINNESILMLPLIMSLKKRLFSEAMSSNFRPYVIAGAGGVFGWYIDGETPKSLITGRDSLPSPQNKTQITPTAMIGFGADIGKPGVTGYGIDVRYQYLHYRQHLGLRRSFNNVQVGFHVNFN